MPRRLAWSHPDDPLLLPARVARGWISKPGASAVVPISLTLAFTAGTALVVASSLYERRGARIAVLGLNLVLAPEFVRQGALQMADVPVAFFLILGVALLARDDQPGAGTLALAGAALRLAAWPKNEALAVAVAVPACHTWLRLREAGVSILLPLLVFAVHVMPPHSVAWQPQRRGIG